MQFLNKERLSTDCLHMTMNNNEDRDRLFKMLSEIDLEYPVDVQIKKAKRQNASAESDDVAMVAGRRRTGRHEVLGVQGSL